MATDAILRTFGDAARVEDVVMRAVEILTAQETSLFTTLQRTTAIDTVHIYLTDTLDTAASNAQEESADYSYDELSTPSRNINLVQHIRKAFKVSDTQRQVQHYHGEDELSRQLSKKLKSFANDAEFNLLRSTLTSGASGTAPKMDGILAGISTSTNYTAHNSGTTWSASILDGLVKNNYEVSNGDLATDLYMGSYLRAVTDTFYCKVKHRRQQPRGHHRHRPYCFYLPDFLLDAFYPHAPLRSAVVGYDGKSPWYSSG
jgi:hypothetical protein